MSLTYPKAKVLQLSFDGDKTKPGGPLIPPKNKTPYETPKFKGTDRNRKEIGVTKKGNGEKLLKNVMSVISNHSQQLCINEELWRRSKTQKHLVETCVSPSGRSTGTSNSYPTIDKIKAWSDEKKFWLTYLPRQQRIFDYQSGRNTRYPSSTTPDFRGKGNNGEEFPMELISFDERCQQYNKQVEWEEKVMAEFDKKYQVRNNRLRNRELAVTLSRYKDFTRNLLSNLKETQTETNHIAAGGSHIPRRRQQSEMERIAQGYSILKELYAMNPPLVIELASQHIRGPPGKRWMGLSRDDITEVLDHLAKGQSNPDYRPFPNFHHPSQGRDLKTGAYSIHDYLASTSRPCFPTSGRNKNFLTSKTDNRASKAPEVPHPPQVIMREVKGHCQKKNRRLKPHQLMPLHIPGPDRLHQNVCVRAYSADMDGHISDVEGCQIQPRLRKNRTKRRGKKVQYLAPLGMNDPENGDPVTLNETGTPGDSDLETETLDFDSGDDGEGITIESFIPCFVNSH